MGPAAPEGGRPAVWRVIFWAAALAVAALRAYYCGQMPVNTGDLVRHLATGVLVGQLGLSAAARPLAALAPGYSFVSWSGRPYSYPVIPLLFFSALAAISPTLVYAKLALSAVEAANALLVARLCGRWWGLLYWCSPLSIWWVSHEGQFEPLQNLLCLLCLLALSKRRVASAGAALALAVQTKVSALVLLPYAALRALGLGRPEEGAGPRELDRRAALRLGAGLALGLLPTLCLYPWFPSVEQVLRHAAPMHYNPYYFNPAAAELFLWHPGWLKALNLATSTGYLILLAVGCARTRDWAGFAGALLFMLVLKLHTNVQFWYLLLLTPFLVPIRDRRWRAAAMLALPLLDLRATGQMIFGPFGFVERHFPPKLNAFTDIAALR